MSHTQDDGTMMARLNLCLPAIASVFRKSAASAGPVLDFTYDALGNLTTANGVTISYDDEERLISSQQNGMTFGAACSPAATWRALRSANSAA